MAKTYYDSAFTGAEIDAAIRTAGLLSQTLAAENAGKLLGVDASGQLAAVDPPQGYDDTALAGRVSALEETISGLLDATGEAF